MEFCRFSRPDAVDLVPADSGNDLHELSEFGYCIASAYADWICTSYAGLFDP